MLRIEFSAMKLINQPSNNLEEVCDEDFETIVKTLQKRIKATAPSNEGWIKFRPSLTLRNQQSIN